MKGRFRLRGIGICCVILLAITSIYSEEQPLRYVDVNLHLMGTPAQSIVQGRGRGGRPSDKKYMGRKRQGQQSKMGMKSFRYQGEKRKKETTKDNYISSGKNLLKLMNQYSIERAVLVPPPRTITNMDPIEIPALMELCKMYPDRFILSAGGDILNTMIHDTPADELTPKVREQFTIEFKKLVDMGVKCVGEIAALHVSFTKFHVYEESPPDHPLFLLLSDLAAKYQLPIDFHMEAVVQDMDTPTGLIIASPNNPRTMKANIPAFKKLLAHNPKAIFIWRHLGWDNTGGKTPQLVEEMLSSYPNLYFAIRIEERTRDMTGKNMPNRIVDKKWKIKPIWLKLFQRYPYRFLIGSDEFITMEGIESQTPQSFEETWQMVDQLPENLRKAIGRDNALRVLGIQ